MSAYVCEIFWGLYGIIFSHLLPIGPQPSFRDIERSLLVRNYSSLCPEKLSLTVLIVYSYLRKEYAGTQLADALMWWNTAHDPHETRNSLMQFKTDTK